MPNIFVSYRRKDSSDVTGRIFDHLKAAFGEEHLFKDVDSILLGTDFREAINTAVQGCGVLLAIIGDDWLNANDDAGARRIDDPEDYVHLEVRSALDRNIPVIPVLVDGATVPKKEDLPEPLRQLALRNAISVRPDPDFRHDMDRLCRDLRRLLKLPDPVRRKETTRRKWLFAGAALIAAVVVGVVLIPRRGPIAADVINRMTVINVTIILQEYQKFQGKALDGELKRRVDQAVTAALEGNHAESIQLLEKIAAEAPLPSIYNNLGVEHAKLNEAAAAAAAFAKAIEKDPSYKVARTNLLLLESASSRSAKEANAITFEASPQSAMLMEALEGNQGGLSEVRVVKGGTNLDRYNIEYTLKPGVLTLVDAGNYDLIFMPTGGGNFVLARGIVIKEGERARINPNVMLGTLMLEPATRKDLPAIKKLQVFQSGTTGYRLIFQESEKLGVGLPITPGSYDIRIETADGEEFTLLKNAPVRERQLTRIQVDKAAAGFVVQKIDGIQMNSIYVVRTGERKIIASTKKFGRAMIVPPDDSYDVVLEQPAGPKTLKANVRAKPGEIIQL